MRGSELGIAQQSVTLVRPCLNAIRQSCDSCFAEEREPGTRRAMLYPLCARRLPSGSRCSRSPGSLTRTACSRLPFVQGSLAPVLPACSKAWSLAVRGRVNEPRGWCFPGLSLLSEAPREGCPAKEEESVVACPSGPRASLRQLPRQACALGRWLLESSPDQPPHPLSLRGACYRDHPTLMEGAPLGGGCCLR